MKLNGMFFAVVALFAGSSMCSAEIMDLSGKWEVQLPEKYGQEGVPALKVELPGSLPAQGIGDDPSPDTKWFQDAGFGIFLHWGVYAGTEGRWNGMEREKDLWGEWIQNRANISRQDYEKLARSFSPSEFNPEDWAKLFKSAGARYVVLTSKHHDGFAMFKSKASSYNIVDWPTSYNRDIVKDLGDSVRNSGMKYGVYYSHEIDWYHAPNERDKASEAMFQRYLQNICFPQVEELLKNQSPLSILWFDIGFKNKPDAERLRSLVRKHGPDTLISGRIGGGIKGDYASGGDNEVPPIVMDPPWESCMTLTHHWANYPQDIYQRSSTEVIRLLAEIRSKGGNLLLNVGPNKKGLIDPRDAIELRRVGAWLNTFGESIYGVKASPLVQVPWGWITAGTNRTLYLHILNMPSTGEVLVPGLIGKIESAWMLGDPKKMPLKVRAETDRDHRIQIPVNQVDSKALDSANTVVALKYSKESTFDTVYLLHPESTNEFNPSLATLSGGAKSINERVLCVSEDDPTIQKPHYDNMALLEGTGELSWQFRTTNFDDYRVVIDYAELSDSPRSLIVKIDNEVFPAPLITTPDDKHNRFKILRLGTVAIRNNGLHTISVRVTGPKAEKPVMLHRLRLIPSRVTPLEKSEIRFSKQPPENTNNK